MKEFRIEFDSPTSAYYAGQIVSGRVILNLQDKPKKVRAVTIQFKGESKVEFSGQETPSQSSSWVRLRTNGWAHTRNECLMGRTKPTTLTSWGVKSIISLNIIFWEGEERRWKYLKVLTFIRSLQRYLPVYLLLLTVNTGTSVTK
uniref:Arrestin-like N-terminal domain-containing protein n=1 Tax=Cacopsylla melanoneura TaxID=428564 RepID=A0A8D8TVZ4_9HEMI